MDLHIDKKMSYKQKKAKLAYLMRQVGELTKEDSMLLEEYIQDRLIHCADNLDNAIACFMDLERGLRNEKKS